MFSHKVMDSELAVGLACDFHKTLVEISLNDISELPTGERNMEPGHCVVTQKYLKYAERIRNLTVYEDDVWIITFPKCGTTWTQEMVWLIDHDLDYETANTKDLTNRSVFLEMCSIVDDIALDTVQIVENLPRPRHIKSHLPVALLPKQLWTVKPKLVYCVRNPKDVAVSYMHHHRHIHGFNGSDQIFLEGLLSDQVLFCPQIKHTLDFWNLHNLPHVIFIHYEEMIKDMMSILRRVTKYFGKTYSEADLCKLAEHLSFDAMKKNPTTNNSVLIQNLGQLTGRKIEFQFMRRGQIGSYKNELTPEYIKRLDRHVEQQLKGTDFTYME